MQTHNTTTTTDATEATTQPQPTLADLLAAYRAELATKRELENENMRARVDENSEHLRAQLERDLSADLRAALQLTIRRSVRYPNFGAVEAYFSLDGVPWSIVDNEEDWIISGPRDYCKACWPLSDTAVLNAINNYPAWLAAQQAEEQQRSEPRRYSEIVSAIASDSFLHRGAKVSVNYARYWSEDGDAVWGTIEAWNKQAILLTLAGGRQLLINWQHIESIEPRYPDQQKPTPAAPETGDLAHNTRDLSNYPDMMSDEIPF